MRGQLQHAQRPAQTIAPPSPHLGHERMVVVRGAEYLPRLIERVPLVDFLDLHPADQLAMRIAESDLLCRNHSRIIRGKRDRNGEQRSVRKPHIRSDALRGVFSRRYDGRVDAGRRITERLTAVERLELLRQREPRWTII